MPEIIRSEQLDRPITKKKKFGAMDVVAFIVLGLIIVVLGITLINKLSLKHEVSSAKVTADKVIGAIAKEDADGLLAQGNKKFQATYSKEELSAKIKPIADIYAKESPTVLKQTVSNGNTGKQVTFIYQYSRLKVPFYIRTTVFEAKNTSSWELTGLSGSPSLSTL